MVAEQQLKKRTFVVSFLCLIWDFFFFFFWESGREISARPSGVTGASEEDTVDMHGKTHLTAAFSPFQHTHCRNLRNKWPEEL